MLRALSSALLLLTLAACGTTSAPGDAETPQPASPSKRRPRRAGPAILAEVGALDAKETKSTFAAAMPAIERCLEKGRERLSFLAGELKVMLRIATDGSVRYAVPLTSTFGDLESERCMLQALSKQTWPRPQGGREGVARQSFRIDAQGRPAVAWSASDLGRNAEKLTQALGQCRSDAGVEQLRITLHVDEDGKPLAAGGSSDDEAGLDAIACAVKAALALRFASPGSWPAKVTIQAP